MQEKRCAHELYGNVRFGSKADIRLAFGRHLELLHQNVGPYDYEDYAYSNLDPGTSTRTIFIIREKRYASN